MLHILAMLGKGIGITLLCILLLLVVFLLALLFVPVRYRVSAHKEEDGKPEGSAKLYWLFHSVSGFALWEWEGRLHYGIRILGILVYDNLRAARSEQKAAKEKKNKRKKNKKKKIPKKEARVEKEMQSEKEMQPEIRPVSTTARQAEKADTHKLRIKGEMAEDAAPEADVPEIRLVGRRKLWRLPGLVWSRLKAFCKAVWRFLCGIWQKLHHLAEKVRSLMEKPKQIKETIERWRAFLEREDFQRAYALCKKQLLRVWENIKPGKIKAEASFGFEDPATTGQVMAVMGMLYPVLGNHIILRPDFENTLFSGKALIKGRITLFILLRAAWMLYFDKDIRHLIQVWKKEETVHG